MNMATYRNWIENKLQKRMVWYPMQVGVQDCRAVYEIEFEDGEKRFYHINFEKEDITEIERR